MIEHIEDLLKHLREVLPQLIASGQNWKVELHGSSNGQIIVERTAKVIVRPKSAHA